MKTINAAVTAMMLSQALNGMVLFMTADPMAPSSSFLAIDYVAAAQADALDELRHSGTISIVADNTSIDDRDDLRITMERLAMDLPDLATLHGEAILFDCGKVVARAAATSVVPSELG